MHKPKETAAVYRSRWIPIHSGSGWIKALGCTHCTQPAPSRPHLGTGSSTAGHSPDHPGECNMLSVHHCGTMIAVLQSAYIHSWLPWALSVTTTHNRMHKSTTQSTHVIGAPQRTQHKQPHMQRRIITQTTSHAAQNHNANHHTCSTEITTRHGRGPGQLPRDR